MTFFQRQVETQNYKFKSNQAGHKFTLCRKPQRNLIIY